MTARLALALVGFGCITACARHAQSYSKCEWPSETSRSPDTRNPVAQRHLSDDAELAEDFAIRYADAHHRPGTGVYTMDEYEQFRNQCMSALFETIAKIHGVTEETVRESVDKRRHTSLDLAVILSFAMLYSFVARAMARGIWRSFQPKDDLLLGVAATVLVSVVFSLAGLLLGECWSVQAEALRIGNTHVSYRMDRIPWIHHRPEIFVCGISIFWIAAALRCRVAARGSDSDLVLSLRILG
jgi:hypothetical protein